MKEYIRRSATTSYIPFLKMKQGGEIEEKSGRREELQNQFVNVKRKLFCQRFLLRQDMISWFYICGIVDLLNEKQSTFHL